MTMADLAALAGVSKITVSRALRDSPVVRAEVRDRIKKIALAHGYRLNAAARSLRTNRAHSVTAVIEMNPSRERPASEALVLTVVGELLQAFTMEGYRLVLTTLSEVTSSNALDTDGLIMLGLGPNDDAIHQIRGFRLPLVVWGGSRPAFDNVVFVASDNYDGGRLVGEHLAGLGRRRILFLGDIAHSEVAERLAGLSGAVANREITVTPLACAFNREAARAVISAEVERGIGFDAIMACSDTMAMGAVDVLKAAGVDIPGDVAVTGFDDMAAEGFLTTVRQEWDLAGEMLADKMLDLLAGRRTASEKLPVRLVIRGSTVA